MSRAMIGGCQCGRVRYTARPSVQFKSYACHCTDCQSQTGSAFALHVWLLAGEIELEGSCIEGRQTNADGATVSTFACADCFSRIYSSNNSRPQLVTLRIGTRDDSAQISPDFHIWTRSKQPWIVLPEGVEAYEEQPDFGQDRLRAMRAADTPGHAT